MTDKKTIQYVLIGLALILSVVGSYFGVTLPAPTIPTPELMGGNVSTKSLAPADKEIVCGTTATFTASTTIASGLTSIDAVIATQITVPAATRAFLITSDPTTTTFTLYSKNSTYGAGTTGITAHYCVVGTK